MSFLRAATSWHPSIPFSPFSLDYPRSILSNFTSKPTPIPDNTIDPRTPPPVPEPSQLPTDLRPTILTPQLHPRTAAVVREVNDFFLTNWPMKSAKHRQRFVEEGYAWFVCILCPMSLDDRMHWGCRLLTTGFLIDDLLDRMSIAEGKAHQEKVVACCRGERQPDRSQPAQWIMYDLFEAMRGIDKVLADDLLRHTVDFLVAQADGERIKPMDLKSYFVYRDADLGKGLCSGIMRFCMGLHMTPHELSLVKSAEDNCMKHITLANDICSFNKEILAAKDGFELGAICSSVPIVKDTCGLNNEGAYRVMWEMTRQLEVRHHELVEEAMRVCDSEALRLYLKGLEYQMAGNERWSLLTPRYNPTGDLGYSLGTVRFEEGR